MRRGGKRFALAGALGVVAVVGFSSTALADDSQIRISKVYSDGSASHGDFIELQMLADGQTLPSGSAVRLCGPAGPPACIDAPFPSNVLPASISLRTVLLAWQDNPNLQPDFGVTSGNFNPSPLGGAACFYQSVAPAPEIPIDCVSWGTFHGSLPSVGSPAPALNATQSLTRSEARGCSTLMEAIDDSDNSAADFSLATPSPRANITTPTEHPCPPAAPPAKKKCKKKKHRSAETAKKKKCKKKK